MHQNGLNDDFLSPPSDSTQNLNFPSFNDSSFSDLDSSDFLENLLERGGLERESLIVEGDSDVPNITKAFAIVQSVIAVVGFLGNFLVIYVYLPAIYARFKQKREGRAVYDKSKFCVQLIPISSSSSLYIINLALADLMFMTSVPFKIYCQFKKRQFCPLTVLNV